MQRTSTSVTTKRRTKWPFPMAGGAAAGVVVETKLQRKNLQDPPHQDQNLLRPAQLLSLQKLLKPTKKAKTSLLEKTNLLKSGGKSLRRLAKEVIPTGIIHPKRRPKEAEVGVAMAGIKLPVGLVRGAKSLERQAWRLTRVPTKTLRALPGAVVKVRGLRGVGGKFRLRLQQRQRPQHRRMTLMKAPD